MADIRENRSRERKRIRFISCLAAVLYLLAGCGGGQKQPEYQQVIDSFAEIVLELDGDSAQFDLGLEAVGSYLEQPDEGRRGEVRQKVQDIINRMDETKKTIVPCAMEEEFAVLLERFQIDPEEYLMYADSRSYDLTSYMMELELLDQYMEFEETSDAVRDDFYFLYRNIVQRQQIMKEYNYCVINYWFAGVGEKEMDYIRQQILDRLVSFASESGTWYDDREAVEKMGDTCLNQISALADELAADLAESEKELYELEKERPGE